MSSLAETGMVPSFFVAYTQQDEAYAQSVCKILRGLDLDVYCMTDNPYNTSNFIAKGHEELSQRTCMLVIVGTHGSDWVEKELLDAKDQGKPIFPVICCTDVKNVCWPNGVNRFGVYVHIRSPGEPDAEKLLLQGLLDFNLLDNGVVPRVALTHAKHFDVNPFLKCEQFASEIIEQPILVRRNEGGGIRIVLNRSYPRSCKYVVISNSGKRELQKTFVYPRISEIQITEHRLERFITETDNEHQASETIKMPDGIPMRWASGGVMPIVTFKRRQWVALLFRDIAPYGWNLPLGASERYSGAVGTTKTATDFWEDELRRPGRLATREFLEEILVIDGHPASGTPLKVRPFSFVNELQPALHEHCQQFGKIHIDLRNEKDQLFIQANGGSGIPVSERHGVKCFVDVLSNEGTQSHHGFLVSVNPSEMGIEMVLPLMFSLQDNDYMLDGEILSSTGVSELVRMPIALFSVDYLRRVFAKAEPFTYVDVPLVAEDRQCAPESRPPSVCVNERPTASDVHVFDWDVSRRRELAQAKGSVTNSEQDRHRQWVQLFDDMFDGSPEKLPIWFTPTTAKTIRMAIATGLF